MASDITHANTCSHTGLLSEELLFELGSKNPYPDRFIGNLLQIVKVIKFKTAISVVFHRV